MPIQQKKMLLVNYSDSESSEKEIAAVEALPSSRTLKRKRSKSRDTELPPLPDTFHDLYASTTRISTQDDPALHSGRQRVTPHIEGNWPTHIYIEWYPSNTESTILNDLLSSLVKSVSNGDVTIQSLLQSELGAEMPLHISLSRSLILVTDQRQSFIDSLGLAIEKSAIRPFKTLPTALKWVPNYENTRWFLVLQLSRPPEDNLNKLLRLSNHIANLLGHPTLYLEPDPQPANTAFLPGNRNHQSVFGNSPKLEAKNTKPLHEAITNKNIQDQTSHFHISIAWSLHPPTPSALERVESLGISNLQGLHVLVKAIKARVGNAVTVFPLSEKPKPSETRGIIGI